MSVSRLLDKASVLQWDVLGRKRVPVAIAFALGGVGRG